MECPSWSISDKPSGDKILRSLQEFRSAEEAFSSPYPPLVFFTIDYSPIACVRKEQIVDEEVSTADSLLDILLPPPSLDKSPLPLPLPNR